MECRDKPCNVYKHYAYEEKQVSVIWNVVTRIVMQWKNNEKLIDVLGGYLQTDGCKDLSKRRILQGSIPQKLITELY